jgi:hypothetical protein
MVTVKLQRFNTWKKEKWLVHQTNQGEVVMKGRKNESATTYKGWWWWVCVVVVWVCGVLC